MKLLYKTIILAITISLSLSCSKDDNQTKAGEIIFENNSYELNHGYINFIDSTDYYSTGIHLTNDNTTFTKNGRKFGKNSKTTIDLILFSGSDNDINNIYPLHYSSISNETLENQPPYLVACSINFNLNQKNGDWKTNPRIFNWNDGSATIENINGEYIITFTLKNENNTITGNYKGPLERVDYF